MKNIKTIFKENKWKMIGYSLLAIGILILIITLLKWGLDYQFYQQIILKNLSPRDEYKGFSPYMPNLLSLIISSIMIISGIISRFFHTNKS